MKFDKSILKWAKKLHDLQEKARQIGMFVEDRELLTCPNCQLLEDVTGEGLLVVYREGEELHDKGLRFIPIDNENKKFRCPDCGTEFLAPEPLDDF